MVSVLELVLRFFLSRAFAIFSNARCMRSPLQNVGMFAFFECFSKCILSKMACLITPSSLNADIGVRCGINCIVPVSMAVPVLGTKLLKHL